MALVGYAYSKEYDLSVLASGQKLASGKHQVLGLGEVTVLASGLGKKSIIVCNGQVHYQAQVLWFGRPHLYQVLQILALNSFELHLGLVVVFLAFVPSACLVGVHLSLQVVLET